jgi:hypothetical protein
MIFVVVEYDAGALLQLSMHQLINTCGAHSRKERCRPLIASRIQGVIRALIGDKLERETYSFSQARDKVAINRLTEKGICIRFGVDFHHCNLPLDRHLDGDLTPLILACEGSSSRPSCINPCIVSKVEVRW